MNRFLALLFLGMLQFPAFSQKLRVAVAANLQYVIKDLQADFKKRTGIETEIIVGSSGKISTQIKNGAPYDVFLSADNTFPQQLFDAGLTLQQPAVYARGSLVICSRSDVDIKNWQKLISKGVTGKICIANPALAPYGVAARQALTHLDLWAAIQDKLVRGESIAQVNTYLMQGFVTLAFTNESFLFENNNRTKLKWDRIPANLYQPIDQSMVVLKRGTAAKYTGALKFYRYILSEPARQIFKRNGYSVP